MVKEAGSGAEALTAMRTAAPDLVLLDLLLPDMMGFDVLDQMQAAPDLRAIPVIVLTNKDLTAAERERLGDVTLWHKANLDRRHLLHSVESALP